MRHWVWFVGNKGVYRGIYRGLYRDNGEENPNCYIMIGHIVGCYEL